MKHDDFQRYLAELRSLPPEAPLEPELKPQRVKLDKRIREEQALSSGAVLTAVLEAGDGGSSPQDSDLVYIHYSIRDHEDELLYSTRSEEGGPGQAFAFLMEKGPRVPRGWELVLRGMTRGQRSVLQVKPEYGFLHEDCGMKPPVRGLPLDQPLRYDITLLNWYPAASVQQYGADDTLIKRSIREATSWESPRPPFEVTLHLTVRCPAYDGHQLTGQRLFSTEGRQPLTLQLGRGLLPPAVEDALSYMSRDELAAFVVPASSMRSGDGVGEGGRDRGARKAHPGHDDDGDEGCSSSGEDGDVFGRRGSGAEASSRGLGLQAAASAAQCLVPPPPAGCRQVELEVELLSMVQVRDMTGTGEVTKKRLREGAGDFPIDCPLNDTTLMLHFKARPLAVAQGATAQAATGASAGDAAAAGAAQEVPADGGGVPTAAAPPEEGATEVWAYDSRGDSGEPLTADTGCGELPEAVEMVLKLMVPGEVSRVVSVPRFAYAGREDCPSGIRPDGPVEFEVELLDFEREGHWQNLSFEERYCLAERLKAKGNELFRRQQYKYAKARYERLLRLLESTRDFEDQEQVARIEGYKVATLGNLALCGMQLAEYAAAVATCNKALEHEPENAKMHFRKGKALSLKGDHEEAADALQLALEYDPASEKDIKAEMAANAERQKAALRKQKRDLGNFLKPK